MAENSMDMLIKKTFERHKSKCEKWVHGEPVDAWFDTDRNLCIKYKDGQWWHYNTSGNWW